MGILRNFGPFTSGNVALYRLQLLSHAKNIISRVYFGDAFVERARGRSLFMIGCFGLCFGSSFGCLEVPFVCSQRIYG